MRACLLSPCPLLIASSSEVYGKSREIPFKEDADVVYGATERSRWSYACSKAVTEFLGRAYYKKDALPVVMVRYFNTTGPRQTGQYGMVLPRFVEQALNQEPLTVYGDGSQSRCFCHVDDVVTASIRLLETADAYGEVVNVGGDELITIRALAEKVKSMTGSSSEILRIPFEEAYEAGFEDMDIRQPDLTKLRTLIDFTPTQNLDTIISDMVTCREKR